jgi:hypothetical protein
MNDRNWLADLVERIRRAAASGSPLCLATRVRVTIREVAPGVYRVERGGR